MIAGFFDGFSFALGAVFGAIAAFVLIVGFVALCNCIVELFR